MSCTRSLGQRLASDTDEDIAKKIPFWEFLDIEYDRQTRHLQFVAALQVKPVGVKRSIRRIPIGE